MLNPADRTARRWRWTIVMGVLASWFHLPSAVAIEIQEAVDQSTVERGEEAAQQKLARPEEAAGDQPLGKRLLELTPPQTPWFAVAERYRADLQILQRYHAIELSPTRHRRLMEFLSGWREALERIDVNQLDADSLAVIQKILADIQKKEDEYSARTRLWSEKLPWLPFASHVFKLAETQRLVVPMDAIGFAKQVQTIADLANKARDSVADDPSMVARFAHAAGTVKHAANDIGDLKKVLRSWFEFYNGYDPEFTWWVKRPHEEAQQALAEYETALREFAKKLAEQAPQTADGASAAATADTEANPPFSLANEPIPDWPISRDEFTGPAPIIDELLTIPANRVAPIIAEFQREFGGQEGRGRNRNQDDVGGQRTRERLQKWLAALEELPYDDYGVDEQVDYHLLRHHITMQLKRRDLPPNELTVVEGPAGIKGKPIGRAALLFELEREMIPYTPEELLEMAARELAWCRTELVIAARELKFGDAWQRAVEHVKSLHEQPGQQPWLVRQLSDETVAYIRNQELMTIPPLANETWRMRMMPVEQQLITPFFTGGEVVSVGFPTDAMSHEAKLQSLRGNNRPFSRATVHHELIPGHGMQQFMTSRYATHRGLFSTPFWTEGWALYWEMLLYDQGFARTPEDRVGFLVWRSHRCARIVFSLSFHLGLMTPAECVDYLVENVGFERLGAEGEVRRSFGGMYPPLYQAAYMVGGLQFRDLEREFVATGRMSHRDFHDFVLRRGRIPVAMVRQLLLNQPLSRSSIQPWRFYELH